MKFDIWFSIGMWSIAVYFAVRGVIEGGLFSDDGIRDGEYHFFRLLETLSVAVIAVSFFKSGAFGSITMVLGQFFLGLSIYEFTLAHRSHGRFPAPVVFEYKILGFSFLMTPTKKSLLFMFYSLMGLGLFLVSIS